ncbi:HGxxPAAW family protein [Microbacterium paludicola]|uniref:HGxxPAAW family protein n=1 Tax=Microbacterium paludicola TaxID=300019 RepID=UPI0031E249F3
MSNHTDDPGHGHSPAAWTAVIIMLVAISLGTVALFIDVWALFWVAVGLLVVGPLVGWIMTKAGYGANGPKYTTKAH